MTVRTAADKLHLTRNHQHKGWEGRMTYGRRVILALSVVLLFSGSANAEIIRKWSYLADTWVCIAFSEQRVPMPSDYNGDSIIDPVFNDSISVVILDGASGNVLYKIVLPQPRCDWEISSVAQIDPDAAPEIVFVYYAATLDSILVLDSGTGDREWVYAGGGTPLVVDLDGDHFCEIVIPSSDTVLCYGWQNGNKVDDEIDQPTLPKELQLDQNYPNPFNPTTTIEFSLRHGAAVSLEIVNLLGRRVTTLMDQSLPAGNYSIIWDGTEADGSPVATGAYFYLLKAGDQRQVKKMILLK
jgi:hypothetical protein